jgi:pilus assembly protein CpaE
MAEKILVVDDDLDTLRLVGLMLQRQGYQIVAANNGTQALALAPSEKPDLILLDVMMPDMDGYEVTRRMRAHPVTANTPIIMFTAKSQVDDKVTGFEAGVDDYLTKPTQPRELFAHIKAVLARGAKARPAAPAAPAVPAAPPPERGHAVGVLSAKAGLGNSTLATNLAVSLQQRTKKDTILAEFRPGEGSIALDLGYTRPEGLGRLLQKKAKEIKLPDVETELVTHNSGVRTLLSTYQPGDARYISAAEHFEAIAQHLVHLGKFIVLDIGAGLTPIVEKVLPLCDELVIVLEPTPYTILRSRALMDELVQRGFGEGRLNVALYNRVRSEFQLAINAVQEQFKHPLAVVFTAAPEVTFQAAKANVPLVMMQPDHLTSQQFMKLADALNKHVRPRG